MELIGLCLVGIEFIVPLETKAKLLTADHQVDEVLEQFEEVLVGEVLIHQQQMGLHVVHVVLFNFSVLQA